MDKKGFKDERDFLRKVGIAKVKVRELIAEFMEEHHKAVMDPAAERRLFGFRIRGEDRPGLLDDIISKLRVHGINLATGDFYKYKKSGKEMAGIELIIEGISGLAGAIQRLQAETIMEKAKQDPKGIEEFKHLSPEEIEELQGVIMRGKKPGK